jgi:hypothetical protein
MAARSTAEEMERLQLSDEDTEDLWNSPSKRGAHKTYKPRASDEMSAPEPQEPHDGGDTLFDRQEAREAALQHELHAVRNINEVIEGLLSSIDKAKGNMEVCPDSVYRHANYTADSLIISSYRPYQKQSHLHQRFLTPGPESYLKPSTINASFSTLTGTVPHKMWLIWRMKRSRDRKRPNGVSKHCSNSGRQHFVKRKKKRDGESLLVVEVAGLVEARYAVQGWAEHRV